MKRGNRYEDSQSDELFSPAYSTAISNDIISGQKEYYMSVGLNSNIKESDFETKSKMEMS